jgi:hypothetical protein
MLRASIQNDDSGVGRICRVEELSLICGLSIILHGRLVCLFSFVASNLLFLPSISPEAPGGSSSSTVMPVRGLMSEVVSAFTVSFLVARALGIGVGMDHSSVFSSVFVSLSFRNLYQNPLFVLCGSTPVWGRRYMDWLLLSLQIGNELLVCFIG